MYFYYYYYLYDYFCCSIKDNSETLASQSAAARRGTWKKALIRPLKGGPRWPYCLIGRPISWTATDEKLLYGSFSLVSGSGSSKGSPGMCRLRAL